MRAVIDRALDGADAVFWLVPPDATRTLDEAWLDFTRPAAEAMRSFGVSAGRLRHCARTRHAAGRSSRAGHRIHRMDDMLMATGAAFRGLAMPSFMENTARQAGVIREKGLFFGPIDPDRKMPFTATATWVP